jgi:hypothetical protein
MTDNTNEPQGRDASDRTEPFDGWSMERNESLPERDGRYGDVWRTVPESDRRPRRETGSSQRPDYVATVYGVEHAREIVASHNDKATGHDVAALRACLEAAMRDARALREQLATVTRELDFAVLTSNVAFDELATIRKRIAAAEALADRWEGKANERSTTIREGGTLDSCADELRVALAGGKPHDESIRDDSEHFT